jgi:hypothetical protein
MQHRPIRVYRGGNRNNVAPAPDRRFRRSLEFIHRRKRRARRVCAATSNARTRHDSGLAASGSEEAWGKPLHCSGCRGPSTGADDTLSCRECHVLSDLAVAGAPAAELPRRIGLHLFARGSWNRFTRRRGGHGENHSASPPETKDCAKGTWWGLSGGSGFDHNKGH